MGQLETGPEVSGSAKGGKAGKKAVSKPNNQQLITNNSGTPAKGKESRQARAQEREAQKHLRKLESQMEKLQAEQQKLTEHMASGDPDLDFAELGIQLAQLNKKLNAAEAHWLEEADRVGG